MHRSCELLFPHVLVFFLDMVHVQGHPCPFAAIRFSEATNRVCEPNPMDFPLVIDFLWSDPKGAFRLGSDRCSRRGADKKSDFEVQIKADFEGFRNRKVFACLREDPRFSTCMIVGKRVKPKGWREEFFVVPPSDSAGRKIPGEFGGRQIFVKGYNQSTMKTGCLFSFPLKGRSGPVWRETAAKLSHSYGNSKACRRLEWSY